MDDITKVLAAIDQGDSSATERLFRLVYDELRRIAAAKMHFERPGQTLQATALVNEACLRLLGPGTTDTPTESKQLTGDESHSPTRDPSLNRWKSRAHFYASAAEAMRRILIENARRKRRQKRGGDRARVDIEDIPLAIPEPHLDLLALDEALQKMEATDELKARIVKLRYFAGLSIAETAQTLDVSEMTVKRHWNYARAWLQREISKGNE